MTKKIVEVIFKITHEIGLDSGIFLKYKTDNRTRGHIIHSHRHSHSWALALLSLS